MMRTRAIFAIAALFAAPCWAAETATSGAGDTAPQAYGLQCKKQMQDLGCSTLEGDPETKKNLLKCDASDGMITTSQMADACVRNVLGVWGEALHIDLHRMIVNGIGGLMQHAVDQGRPDRARMAFLSSCMDTPDCLHNLYHAAYRRYPTQGEQLDLEKIRSSWFPAPITKMEALWSRACGFGFGCNSRDEWFLKKQEDIFGPPRTPDVSSNIIQKVEEFLNDNHKKRNCLNSVGRTKMWCYGFASVVDPLLAYGLAVKVAKIPAMGKLIEATKTARPAAAAAPEVGRVGNHLPPPGHTPNSTLPGTGPRIETGLAERIAQAEREFGRGLTQAEKDAMRTTYEAEAARVPIGIATGPAAAEHATRISRAERILGRPLSAAQRKAVEDAHLVGKGEPGLNGGPAGIGNYTQAQLDRKARILREAGINEAERRMLMEAGVVGTFERSAFLKEIKEDTIKAANDLVASGSRAADGDLLKSFADLCNTRKRYNGNCQKVVADIERIHAKELKSVREKAEELSNKANAATDDAKVTALLDHVVDLEKCRQAAVLAGCPSTIAAVERIIDAPAPAPVLHGPLPVTPPVRTIPRPPPPPSTQVAQIQVLSIKQKQELTDALRAAAQDGQTTMRFDRRVLAEQRRNGGTLEEAKSRVLQNPGVTQLSNQAHGTAIAELLNGNQVTSVFKEGTKAVIESQGHIQIVLDPVQRYFTVRKWDGAQWVDHVPFRVTNGTFTPIPKPWPSMGSAEWNRTVHFAY